MKKMMFFSIMIIIYCCLTAILPDPEYRIWPLLTEAVSNLEVLWKIQPKLPDHLIYIVHSTK